MYNILESSVVFWSVDQDITLNGFIVIRKQVMMYFGL